MTAKLTDKEIQLRQRVKDDFIHYARTCLRLRTKAGSIEPFILNRAQLHVHNIVEQQKLETGNVRCLVLKGRQQGMCCSVNTQVLTADYRWIKIDDVKVGDRLVACDENSIALTKSGKKQARKFRTSIVEAKREFHEIVYEILLDNGAKLEITSNHKMLCQKRGGCEPEWREAKNFIIGDCIRVVTKPPTYNCQTHEDGWIAGIIDGEGSSRGEKGAKRLSLHQTPGKVLDRMKDYFHNIDMPYKEVIDKRTKCGQKNKLGNKPVHRLDIARMPYLMELFARCRPTRFTNNEWHVGHELPGKSAQDGIKPWAKIISIKPLKKQRVIDLQTSTKTFICEGLVSHNSTLIEGRFYWLVTHRRGVRAFILTHEGDATNNLFEMALRYHQYCPEIVRPMIDASNAKELSFGKLDSGYRLGTAGNKSTGRSSTIQYLHGSEAAFWENAAEHAKGILQAVPNEKGTEIFIESTANGLGNYFHQQWQMAETGESDFKAIFVPWYWQDEYVRNAPVDMTVTDEEQNLIDIYNLTNNQLAWRRNKIVELSVGGLDGTKAFMQEYPCTAVEAFQTTGEDSFIAPAIVMAARKGKAERHGALLVGVDPARFGDDRTSIIRRQGRVAFGMESYHKKDTMEVAGMVHRIIEEEKPIKVFIDVGGLGAGVFDRLKELGHYEVIVAVNSGNTPLDQKRYFNKRAEMWGLMREWLLDLPTQIPDIDSLHADLCGIQYKFDSKTRLVMEKKEDMKKRGLRSPDEADALALTFAMPDRALIEAQSPKSKSLAQNLMSHYNTVDKLRKKAYG